MQTSPKTCPHADVPGFVWLPASGHKPEDFDWILFNIDGIESILSSEKSTTCRLILRSAAKVQWITLAIGLDSAVARLVAAKHFERAFNGSSGMGFVA